MRYISRNRTDVHSTNDLNDGYMGSGTALKFSIENHGVENFSREIHVFHERSSQRHGFL